MSIVQNMKIQTKIKKDESLNECILTDFIINKDLKLVHLIHYELFPYSEKIMTKVFFFPIRIFYIIFLPYETNPLMYSQLKYVVILMGFLSFSFTNMLYFDIKWEIPVILASAIVFCHFCLMCFSCYNKHEKTIQNIFCFLICSSFIFLSSQIIKDLLLFICFQAK